MNLLVVFLLLGVTCKANATDYPFSMVCASFTGRSEGFDSGGYGSNLDDAYIITGQPGAKFLVTLRIILQSPTATVCIDYVKAYDGATSSDPVILEPACGNTVRKFETTGNVVRIELHSDGSIEDDGFMMVILPFCETCDLEGCEKAGVIPPACGYREGYCHWGRYSIFHLCQNGPGKQCVTPCYNCNNDDTIPSCIDLNMIEWTLVEHTPCDKTVGLGMMVERYKHNTNDEEKTCLRPCCCNPKPPGAATPSFNCGSDGVNKIDPPGPPFCPNYKVDFKV